MKKVLRLILAFQLLTLSCFSQTDTIYKYLRKDRTETTKDSAVHYVKFYRDNNTWLGKEYNFKNEQLESEGSFSEPALKKRIGSFKHYNDDGSLSNVQEYSEGKLTEKTYYYKNGNKRSSILYNKKNKSEQKGWDENGQEIKNFIVEKGARFEGGAEGWRRYLEEHLNVDAAAQAGAPVGNYIVRVEFVIDKEGRVSEIGDVQFPTTCRPCATEAVRVIMQGPLWEPAIQNNVPVIYQAIQYVTFQVSNR